jgi:hypothetical protein
MTQTAVWIQRSAADKSHNGIGQASAASGVSHQALRESGVAGHIDSRPSHGQRAVRQGLVCGFRDAVRRELGLVIDRRQRLDAASLKSIASIPNTNSTP